MPCQVPRQGIAFNGPRRPRVWLAAASLLALAVLLRILHARSLAGSVLVEVPILDARIYSEWAAAIASGDLLARAPFFMGPLYAYVLAVAYALGGPGLGTALTLQAVLGIAALAGVFALARALFGDRAALAALALGVLYGPLLHAESFALMTPLVCLLGVAAALFAVRAIRSGGAREALGAGLLFGLGGAARADFLVAWPLVAFLIGGAARARRRAIAAFAAGTVAALLPVLAANAVRGGGVLLTWNGGWNLYVGNHEGATGVFAYPPGVDPDADFTGEAFAERSAGRDLSPAEVSRYYAGRAAEFIRKRPGRFVTLMAERARLFFSAGEIPQNESYDFMRTRSPILKLLPIGFAVAGPLALAGLVLARRRAGAPGGRDVWVPAALAAAPFLTGILFFVTGRFRLPAVPLLLPYAGLALDRGFAALGARRWRPLAAGAAATAAVAAAILAMPRGYDRASAMALETVHEGIRLEEKGLPAEAVRAYERAIRYDPKQAMAYHNLAAVFVKQAAPDRAIPLYRRAVELDPESVRTLYNLGVVYGRVGDHSRAIEFLARAVALQPDWIDGLYDLGVAYANAGRGGEAERTWRRVLTLEPGDRRTIEALESLAAAARPESAGGTER